MEFDCLGVGYGGLEFGWAGLGQLRKDLGFLGVT